MNRPFQLLALAAVTLALAGVATWSTALSFPLSLTLVAAGILASGFMHSAGKVSANEGHGAAAHARTGIALGVRLMVGTGVLVLMLLSMLWWIGGTGAV
ncbi:hypothetical protein [Xanthomonas sp. XNM01]|uniref:hypothetical protein n=1 Tax=Xanthomonas sp. XNM01 TaxID=2769289 RepID=UPI00178400DE|nr:hypothetical protein [Xanthomonas sp. XNM01]MBD9369813.1 hypothetical protein [Xanthomonas sp. XNM01]